jgi:hypothetical protein
MHAMHYTPGARGRMDEEKRTTIDKEGPQKNMRRGGKRT